MCVCSCAVSSLSMQTPQLSDFIPGRSVEESICILHEIPNINVYCLKYHGTSEHQKLTETHKDGNYSARLDGLRVLEAV